MQTITSQELKSKIENKESFVVDFFATWCGPCKVLMNNLKIAEQKGLAAPVYTFDVDSDREFSVNELGIRSVPTVKYFKNGIITETKTGVQTPDQLVESVRSVTLV
jgi:thioredoxin 1